MPTTPPSASSQDSVSVNGSACPRCRTSKVRLSPARSSTDRLLGLVTIYHLRCQLCAHRFPVFFGRRLQAPRRGYERLPVGYPVWFRPTQAAEGSSTIEGTLVNLSIRGCRIRCATVQPLGTHVTFEFQPSPYAFPITIDRAVVRSQSSDAIGLRFVRLARSDERRLGRVLDLYLNETPAPNDAAPA